MIRGVFRNGRLAVREKAVVADQYVAEVRRGRDGRRLHSVTLYARKNERAENEKDATERAEEGDAWSPVWRPLRATVSISLSNRRPTECPVARRLAVSFN